MSPDTLRHYERRGLLAKPLRTPSGYRCYAPETLDRVMLIRRALSLGFSIAELTRILGVRDQGGAPCRQVRALAEEKLREVERGIADLEERQRDLQAILTAWDKRLASVKQGERACLLESLNGKPKGRSTLL